MEGELILGVDPGSRITGYAVLHRQGRQLTVIDSGMIRLRGSDSLSARLGALQQQLETVLDRARPDVAAVEDVFASRNVRSALALGQARGAVLAALGRRSVLVEAYPPATVKRTVTGHGRASKQQIQRMVEVLLGLDRQPATDEADAMAVAICHAMARRANGAAAIQPVSRGSSRSRRPTAADWHRKLEAMKER